MVVLVVVVALAVRAHGYGGDGACNSGGGDDEEVGKGVDTLVVTVKACGVGGVDGSDSGDGCRVIDTITVNSCGTALVVVPVKPRSGGGCGCGDGLWWCQWCSLGEYSSEQP